MVEFTGDFLKKYWSNGKLINFEGNKYSVHKMNYGQYFFQPINWMGGETDGFAPNTLWLEKVNFEKDIYNIEENLFKQ